LYRRRASRIFGAEELRHRFVFGRGMVSDDTEHACMVGQSLLAAGDDDDQFVRQLAYRLRWWLVGLPAGVGLATARSILKLWLGFGPTRSGVFSAGNGPAMRAAVLGICLANHPERLRKSICMSTRVTHTDPRAETGAALVGLAAACAGVQSHPLDERATFFERAWRMIPVDDCEIRQILGAMHEHLDRGATIEEFAASHGLHNGVTGYIYHTVPVALYCWLAYPRDFRPAVEAAIRLGGDTDTLGAIVGALCGATVGAPGIPDAWLTRLFEWPRSESWMRSLASRLAERFPESEPGCANTIAAIPFFWPGQLLRNLAFLTVVLCHGFRRLLPPY
jgi:ADP-ribosylglycohydrolase